MNLVLIGYRGCGKSSVGRILAGRLGMVFVDSDAEVCGKFGGVSIKEIWEKHGEPAFRAAECEVTRELLGKDGRVIALGGGTPMQPDARAAIEAAKEAVCVYLKCEPAELLRRIAGDTQTSATRPNLTSLGGGLEEIRKMLALREPVYQSLADFVVDVTRSAAPDVPAREIEQRFVGRS